LRYFPSGEKSADAEENSKKYQGHRESIAMLKYLSTRYKVENGETTYVKEDIPGVESNVWILDEDSYNSMLKAE